MYQRCIRIIAIMLGIGCISWVCHLPAAIADSPIPVFVSIAPQKYFVGQIGQDRVEVQVMTPPGASPHAYEPKPKQMTGLATAQAYFAIGVAFEEVWLKKIIAANPAMKVVYTQHGIEKIPMAAHHRGAGESEHYDHGILDPHIWLSPPLVKIQARAIVQALTEIDPAHGAEYEANYHGFIARIDELDAELKKIFEGKQGLRFMVFHPAWGYLAQAYKLVQTPIELEGKDPKPAQLKELIEQARAQGIKVIFAQPQFSARSAELIAREIGGQVIFADPLAEDWLANLRAVAGKFRAALK